MREFPRYLEKVFPAPAGMNRPAVSGRWQVASVPRASGDEPAMREFPRYLEKCSPRQRG